MYNTIVSLIEMSIDNIIALAGLLLTIIIIAVQQASRISIIETKYKDLNDTLKLHESLNEKSFSKIEDELKEINEKLNKLLGYLEAKNNERKNN